MNWKWILVISIAVLLTAYGLSPDIHWDGAEPFMLALSETATAETDAVFYRTSGSAEGFRWYYENNRNCNPKQVEQFFESFTPVSVSPDRKFVVEVPAGGRIRFWGLWRTGGTGEYVILMAIKKNGNRVFKQVSVKSTEPIDFD